MSNTQAVTDRLRVLVEQADKWLALAENRAVGWGGMPSIPIGLVRQMRDALVAPVAAAVVPSVDEILRNMISGEESCARPRPAYLRALRDVRKVFAAAPPVVAPVATLDEHPDNTLKIACAELAGYYDGFEGLPVNATYSTSDENLAYQLWFEKARKVRSDLVDQIDTLAKLLTDARAQLAPPVAPVVAPVQEQADDLCGRCGYQRFRHTAYYQRQHGQTMPAAPQICNAFTSPSLPLTQPVAAPVRCDCDGPSKCAEHDAVKQLVAKLLEE